MERNPAIPFTYKYSQPEEYHFSLDSVEMPWEVAQHFKERIAEDSQVKKQSPSDYLKNKMRRWQTLDLCAGCGVLGFELNFHLPQIRQIDFVEVQEAYRQHFESNKSQVQNDGEFQFFNLNYEDLMKDPAFSQKYQLILCNPPYFKIEQGKLSPSEFKNRCRFFIDSTFQKLIEAMDYCLASDGEAYLLLRDLDDHGIDLLAELRNLIKGNLTAENLTLVRGTFLLKLYR
jgi:tRNA1Val (adenine37-N6)-methyltransferase